MFLKVFKYDFKAIFFKFIPMLIILPVLAVLVRLFNLVSFQNVFLSLIMGLVNGVFVLGCIVAIIYNIVICIMRYVKSLFRDQGYLTHTLPLNKHQLLLSQILADVLMSLITFLLIFLCLNIAYFSPFIIPDLIEMFNQIYETIISEEEVAKNLPITLVLTFFTCIASSLMGLFVIYLGVAIGHAFAKNKGILSVVFCIGLNYAINFVFGFMNIIFAMSYDPAVVDISTSFYIINMFLSVTLIESIVICIGGYFAVIYIMKHKLNLE